MRRILRWLFGGSAGLLLAITVGMFIPRPLFPALDAAEADGGRRKILVLSNPIHTDIAVPLDDALRQRFAYLTEAGMPLDAAQWLIFGWGGRSFYLETPRWSDLKPLPVFRALTLDRSVMHVDLAGRLNTMASGVLAYDLGPQDYERLLTAIEKSFVRVRSKVVPIEGASYSGHDRFFEAEGYFNAFAGCNTWTAGVLREAGLRTGLWNPLPQSLGVSLSFFN